MGAPYCDTYACPTSWINNGALIGCGGADITSCTQAICCTEPPTCDTYKDCKEPTAVNKGKGTYCSAVCDAETCCTIDVATCFPGDAQVSTQHGYAQRLDSIQPGMQVFVGDNFEPILGMLHTPEMSTSLHLD